MTEKLMPCPFCGAGQARSEKDLTGVWVEKSDHDEPEYHVQCWACEARSKTSAVREFAIADWNTRHPTPAADEVEAEVLDLLFQIDNLDPAEIAKSPSYIKETVRAAIAAMQARSAEPAGEEPVARKVIERAVADDLLRAIYKAEGWAWRDKSGFETISARCNSVYEITADPRRNRYVATPLRPATPTNPERLVDGWRSIDSAPKDGSWFLACDAIDGAHYAAAWDGDENWKANCGQYVTDTPEPTHWMPLPAAPLKEGEGE